MPSTNTLLTPELLAEIATRSARMAEIATRSAVPKDYVQSQSMSDRDDLLSHARAMQALLVERDARIVLAAAIAKDRSDDLAAALDDLSDMRGRVAAAEERSERLTKALREALGDLIPEEAWDDAAAALSEARPERRDPQAPKDRRIRPVGFVGDKYYGVDGGCVRSGKDRRKQSAPTERAREEG